ncbi:hypothetical protein [Citrobacter portucalensis]|uniref:hypothetical protein n=1 Tax=Citrobacter portucalensis TaxID=1639133 RepID=UPI001F22B03B|nr:hypothetical protein [Citrobacter portucalensis]
MIKVHDITYGTPTSSVKDLNEWLDSQSEHIEIINIETLMNISLGSRIKEGANKQVISSQADSLIKISRIWADFFPANTSNQPI